MISRSILFKSYILAIVMLIISLTLTSSTAQSIEDDLDEDGLPDDWELTFFDNITIYGAEDDPDNDGMSNLAEYQNGTDPVESDTDNDGMPDGWEVKYDLDPTDSSNALKDTDGDGYSNRDEYINGTDPTNRYSPTKKSKDDGDAEALMQMDSSNLLFLLILFTVPSIVILLVIIFVYTKMRREQLLEHRVRANIYDYINRNPGVHYRGIMSDLNLQMGVLTHHLNMLEQEQYIKSAQDGMYRRFYPKNAVVNTALILNDVQTRILQLIQSTPGISQVGISRTLGLTRKVVYYHVKILANAGFVHMETAGRESQCYYIEGLDGAGQPVPGGQGQAQPSQQGLEVG